jgi:hypothetical protein
VVCDKSVQLRYLIVSGEATRPADDQQPWQVATPSLKPGERLDRDIGALEGLDTADEQQHWFLAQAERLAGTVPRACGEERMIDAWGNDLDAKGLGSVMRDEFVHLGHRVGRDQVAARNHAGFGIDPILRLAAAGLGLDAGERVERRHEREVEFVLESVTGHSRQPVVGVKNVGRSNLELIAHPVGEGVDHSRKVFLRERHRSRIDVHDLETGFHRHPLR